MKHQQILDLASSLYTSATNQAHQKITQKKATQEVNDAIKKFVDILIKHPGYEGRAGRIIT